MDNDLSSHLGLKVNQMLWERVDSPLDYEN